MAEVTSIDPPSGTRDFLAAEVRRRERAFAIVRDVFERFGFEPLQTPAFERIEVLLGKYGEEADKLVFKILRRGEHEASGEADLALRYDLTVPLARVAASYAGRLPNPFKRYAIAPVWRADRPGRGRFREFVQCDLDVVGSSSPLADAEVALATIEALVALGVGKCRFLVNSRLALAGMLAAYGVPDALGGSTLVALDKLDKAGPGPVERELVERGLAPGVAGRLVEDLQAPNADARVRAALATNAAGASGLAEVDALVELIGGARAAPAGAGSSGVTPVFAPQLVRGLDYYTGIIFEVVTPTMTGSIAGGGRYDGLIARLGGPDLPACGGSLGIERILAVLENDEPQAAPIDVAVAVMGDDLGHDSLRLAGEARRHGVRTGVYLGPSARLGRQLRWAAELGARWCLLYGPNERAAGVVTVRDLRSGQQDAVPEGSIGAELAARVAAEPPQIP